MMSTEWIVHWFRQGLSMAKISTIGNVQQSTIAAVIGQYIDREYERFIR